MTSQSQILNKILQTKDFSFITTNNLSEIYFFDYLAEFRFIKNHYDQYQVVPDELTFKTVFPNFDFYKVSEPDGYLLEQLTRDYNQSYLASQFNMMKKLLEADKVDEAAKCYFDSVQNLHIGPAIQSVDLVADTGRYKRFLERIETPDQGYLRTGFEELDNLTGGIDRENENMVIVARTGKGKSWTLLKMAVTAVKAGLNVGMYSGEMSLDKVGYRFDTLMGQVDNRAIMRGWSEVTPNYKAYIENLTSIANNGHFHVLTPAEISGDATVDALRGFVDKKKLDILFIDQYSLLEDTSRARTTFEQVANISKAVKKLQVKAKIPIISVAQQNRTKSESEDKTPDTTQIGLSDRIGQDATTVLMLERENDDLIINVVKARDGGEGKKLRYNCDFNFGIFNYVPQEDDGQTPPEEYQNMADSYEQPIPESYKNVQNPYANMPINPEAPF